MAIGVALLGVYALFLGRRRLDGSSLGGIPMALVLGIYNWVSFGSPVSVGYSNLLPGGFANGMSAGILGVDLAAPVDRPATSCSSRAGSSAWRRGSRSRHSAWWRAAA